MLKYLVSLTTALVAGLILFGSATTASAHYRHGGCCGGPIRPSYVYHTANSVRHVTHYRDVSHTNYVVRTHRIVHVTQVRPIIYVNTVTRVHHHTVGIVRPVYEHATEVLPARTVMTGRVINTYDCVCSGRRCR